MTEQSAAASFKQWQVQQTVEALKKNSAAVRAVCDIRQYVDGLDAGVATCRGRNGKACIRCVEAERIVEAIRALLPDLGSSSVGVSPAGGGDLDERHASDPDGRRPGLVTPDP